MNWQTLLADRRVRQHNVSKQELDGLRALVERDLHDANISDLSSDRRFATAYNAALQLCKMAVACAGYRVASVPGHHQTTFEAAELALGMAGAPFATYFEACRRKRNTLDYDFANVVSTTEAAELVTKAQEFRELIESWVSRNHPEFAT